MTDPSLADNDPPRRSRTRRREAMINAVATVLGCMALVVMIATLVRVVMVKLWESARVNPEYVQSVYDNDVDRFWSRKTKEQPALLAEHNSQHKSNENSQSSKAKHTSDLPVSATVPQIEMDAFSVGKTVVSDAEDNPTAHVPTQEKLKNTSALTLGIQNIESKRQKIENSVRGFFESSMIDGKLAFARDPQRVRPLMENYYRTHSPVSMQWKSLGWVLPVDEAGYHLGYAQAVFFNAEPVSLIIEELDDGSFRVDWESSVRYGEIPWNEFINSRPSSPTLFRVIASKPQHPPPPSETPQGSEVLELKHPDEDAVVYAYFDRKDPKFTPLLQQLQSGNWKDVPLTLRLCYPGPTGGGKSARIANVEGKGWLILQTTRS